MKIKIKKKYLDEIKNKHTTYTLSKYLTMEQTLKIFRGEANFTVKTYCKLCKIMGWEYPEHLEVTKDD